MQQDFSVETRIDAHRTIILSSEAGRSCLDEAAAALFPSRGGFVIHERDDRLPQENGPHLLAKAASLVAAEKLIKVFLDAAAAKAGKYVTQPF